MVEGAPLLRAYGSKAHRGFESLPLRHMIGKFLSVWISWLSQRRSGDSNPRYGIRGFDKIAEGDFGRRSAAAMVRSEAEDERRSREQSLPLRHALVEFSSFSFRLLRQRRSGDNARPGGPKGEARSAE